MEWRGIPLILVLIAVREIVEYILYIQLPYKQSRLSRNIILLTRVRHAYVEGRDERRGDVGERISAVAGRDCLGSAGGEVVEAGADGVEWFLLKHAEHRCVSLSGGLYLRMSISNNGWTKE